VLSRRSSFQVAFEHSLAECENKAYRNAEQRSFREQASARPLCPQSRVIRDVALAFAPRKHCAISDRAAGAGPACFVAPSHRLDQRSQPEPAACIAAIFASLNGSGLPSSAANRMLQTPRSSLNSILTKFSSNRIRTGPVVTEMKKEPQGYELGFGDMIVALWTNRKRGSYSNRLKDCGFTSVH
jgi:hypothetical protein